MAIVISVKTALAGPMLLGHFRHPALHAKERLYCFQWQADKPRAFVLKRSLGHAGMH